MKTRIRHIVCFLVVFGTGLWPSSGLAQDTTGNQLRAWMEDQRSNVENVGSLHVVERGLYEMDGGFGRQVFEFDASRSIGSETVGPGRVLSNLRMNGQVVPANRGGRFSRTIWSRLGPEVGRHLQAFRFPIQEIARMTPSREMSEEVLEGRQMWRIDMTSRNREGPFERLTLWFSQSPFQLKASLAVAAAPGRSSVQIRTEYQRIGSLDLPVSRETEGSAPVRRRMRMFTMLFNQQISYSEYELSFKE